jgi:hypothetical protein
MKARIKQFLFYSAIVNLLLITSCSKDEEREEVSNKIVINGQTLPLKHGYISEGVVRTDFNGDEGLEYLIFLTSTNLTLDADGEPSGKGDVVIFELTSASTTHFENGTYPINNSFNVGTAFADVLENFNVELHDYDKYYTSSPGGGSVTITKSGDKYILKFSMTVADDDTFEEVEITGSFEGLLTEVDLF